MRVKIFFRCWSKDRKKSKYFKRNRSTKRFAFFFFFENYLFRSYMLMFPAYCFRQRTYVAQDHENGAPCATYVL